MVEKVSNSYWLNEAFFYFVASTNVKIQTYENASIKTSGNIPFISCLKSQAQVKFPVTNNNLRNNLSQFLSDYAWDFRLLKQKFFG